MNTYFDSLKRFLHKENYDFNRVDISIYNFHPQLLFCLSLNGITKSKKKSIFRFVCPFFAVSIVIAVLLLEIMFISHYLMVKDYSLAAECTYYLVVFSVIPMVCTSTAINTSNLLQIIEKMNNDFNMICNKDKKEYREHFLKGQLNIWKVCAAWFSLVSVLWIIIMLFPLVCLTYYSLFVTQDENTVRPLLFPVWLPHDDPYRTPIYEIFLVYEIFCAISFIPTFCVYIYILCHILLHYCTIINIIIMDFDVLFDGLEENVVSLPRHDPRRVEVQRELNRRICNIVKMHLSVLEAIKTVSSIYGFPLMYQVSFSAPNICITAYQVAKKLENRTVDVLFTVLVVVAVIQIWIPCYLGSMMTNKAFTVGDACWNCKWYKTTLGQLVRSDIIIIILRAQQAAIIKFVGLPSVSLETFSLIITKAYSYFNILRQYA